MRPFLYHSKRMDTEARQPIYGCLVCFNSFTL